MPWVDADDLAAYGVQAAAFANVDSGDVTKALEGASEVAASYLRSRIQPTQIITSVGEDVKMHICMIAAYNLMSVRGFKPSGDTQLAIRAEQARSWFRSVGRGETTPAIVTTTAEPQRTGARVLSSPPRGWAPWGRSRTYRG